MNELPDAQIKMLDCLRIDTDWQGTAFWIVPESVLEFARKVIAADRALRQAGPAEHKLQKVLQTLNENGFEPVQPAAQPAAELAEICAALASAHKESTQGKWQRGQTSHHTATEKGYKIGEFHHACDAEFCDKAHELLPVLLATIAQPVQPAAQPTP